MNELERLNQQLEAEAPAAWSALSPLGRRIYYPPDIPFQAGQARGTRYNATIGQITDGAGRVLRLGPIERALRLEEPDLNQALLYSPIDGVAELREAWGTWERPDGAPHDRLITFVADRPGHDFRYAIDASKIEAELGWRPSVTLDEGLRRTVRWYLDNESWWRAIQQRTDAQKRRGLG